MQAPPAFEDVLVYDPPAVGYLSKGQMVDPLNTVRWTIDREPQTPGVVLSDVVLVYFRGREMAGSDALYLLSSDYAGDKSLKRSATKFRRDRERVRRCAHGVQVVMLDAERVGGGKADAALDPFDGTHLGVLHSFWSGAVTPPVQLLGLLQKGWPSANTLGDLAKQVEQLCPPQLSFHSHVPPELTGLEFGGKP